MLPSFPSNAYADHCLLLDSDVILPSKLSPSFLSFSPSFDYFLGGHDQENELHLLTQSFDCSSLDYSARRLPSGITNVKSMMPQAEGVAVLSFPNDTDTAGHGTPCTGAPANFDQPNNNNNKNNKAVCDKKIIKNIFVAGDHQQRKRSGKKDRHSKIVTAQGPRDRRMRLSLDIARRFFDLQDRLGHDKASKTVEWLMSNSKGAIKEVMQGLLHPKEGPCGGRMSRSSYTSDCDDTSGVEETPIDYNEDADPHEQNYPLPIITSTDPKSRKNKTVRKPTFILSHGKESRAMARARARERTKEKRSRRMEIGHEKKDTTATTPATITSRYRPQMEQQGFHFANYQQQTITPIAITNPDEVYNFIHEDWAAHGGIRY